MCVMLRVPFCLQRFFKLLLIDLNFFFLLLVAPATTITEAVTHLKLFLLCKCQFHVCTKHFNKTKALIDESDSLLGFCHQQFTSLLIAVVNVAVSAS